MGKNKRFLKFHLLFICGLLLVGINYNCMAEEVIGHWEFGDAANPGQDSSAAGNNLTVNGAPVVNDGTISLRGGTIALPLAERDFLYSNSSDFELGNESFTVECWFKSPVITYMNLVSTRSTIRPIYTSQSGWSLGLDKSQGAILFVVNDSNNNCTWARVTVPASTWDGDEWNYLVGIRDRANNTVKLYLNNELVDTRTDECGDITKTNNLKIGYDAYTGYLTEGTLKNIRISRGVISATEIASRYEAGIVSEVAGAPVLLKYEVSVPADLQVDITDGLNGELNLQPQPINLTYSQQYTALKTPLYIQLPTNPTDQQQVAEQMLIADFSSQFNINLATLAAGEQITDGTVIRITESAAGEHSESYQLTIQDSANVINIDLSSADHGIIYGALTLMQVIGQASLIENMQISIPTQVTIDDYPKVSRRIQVRLLSTTLTDSDAAIHGVMMRIARTRLNYYKVDPMLPTVENIARVVDIARMYGINVIATIGYTGISRDLGRAMTIEDIGPILTRFGEAADAGCKGISFHFDDLGEYKSAAADYPDGVGAFQRAFLIEIQDVAQTHDVSFVSMCPTMYKRSWESDAATWFGDPSNYANYFEEVSHLPDGDIELFHTDITNMADLENLGVRQPAYYLNGVWGSKQMLGVYAGPNRLTWSWYGFEVDPVKGPILVPETMNAWQNIANNGIETVWMGSGSFAGAMIAGIWMWNPDQFDEASALKEINRRRGIGAGTFDALLTYEENILPLVALFKTYINSWTSEFNVNILEREHLLNADDLIVYWKNYQQAEMALNTINTIIEQNSNVYHPGDAIGIIDEMAATLDLFRVKLLFKLKRKNIYVVGLNWTDSDLLGHWKLDSDANNSTADFSANSNDGTIYGQPLLVSGISSNALEFDGINDYVKVDTTVTGWNEASNKLSLMGWFYREDGAEAVTGIDKAQTYRLTSAAASSTSANWALWIVDSNGASYSVTTPAPVNNREWHHIAGTYDGNTLRLYVDGQEVSSLNATFSIKSSTTPLEIGRRDQARYFKGKIDEVKIMSVAASAAYVANEANINVLGHWNLNSDLGALAIDSVGKNNGTINGQPILTAGINDNALEFDGINDYIKVATDCIYWREANNKLSIMGWFYREDEAEAVTGIDKAQTYRLTSNAADSTSANWTFTIIDSNGSWHSISTPAPVNNQEWHHIAGTYDGNTLRLYIDGIEVSSQDAIFSIRNTTSPLEIGRRDQIRYFKGRIDEVKIMAIGASPAYILDEVENL
jgi:Concanavalin A-like lectin/glucanases superfamily/Glycosyl hydrolase family 20, domain 2